VRFDTEAVRSDFPYLDQRVYLNTASTGVARKGLGQASAQFFDEMYSRGFDGRDLWRSVLDDVRAQIGRMAHVQPGAVGFAGSTTEALNQLALALPIREGDRVAFCHDEFPSIQAAAGILAQRGASLVPVEILDETMRTEALAAAAQDSRVVLVSHVHWETGTKVDLGEVSKASRAVGSLLIVDGVQALGATPVDADLADAYVAGVFKWLISGFGLAVGIIGPLLSERLEPVMRGYANPPPSRQLTYSHANYPALFTLQASLSYLEGLGWEAIYSHNDMLRRRLQAKLVECGATVITPDAAASIVSAKATDPQALAARLSERGVSVEARGAHLRVSPHFYNTEADIDRFAEIYSDIQGENV
jgi:selenocysteine lyase/cysteine desulfurase